MIVGKKDWIIPDCELPPEGEGVLKGHESVIIVNDTDKKAIIKVKLYFADKDAYEGITWEVEPQRVRCFRMNICWTLLDTTTTSSASILFFLFLKKN